MTRSRRASAGNIRNQTKNAALVLANAIGIDPSRKTVGIRPATLLHHVAAIDSADVRYDGRVFVRPARGRPARDRQP